MILKNSHNNIKYNKNRGLNKTCKTAAPIYEVCCDKCNKIFIERSDVFEKRLSLINKDYCGKCARPLMSSLAGIKGTYNKDGTLKPNKGRFSTERVKAMNKMEYEKFCSQRKKASKDFHKKLSENPVMREEHYKKIFKNSTIGYISKAQRTIGEILKEDGFLIEQYVEGMMCDIVNYQKKIIIEYNGDLFHANPRIYSPDTYIDIIKMKAKEKWAKDRAKNFRLRGLGWQVIVIWENEWNNDRELVLTKLKTFKSKNWVLPKWRLMDDVTKNTRVTIPNSKTYIRVPTKELKSYINKGYVRMKFKKISNKKLNKNKQIPYYDVESYLKEGWQYGWI